MEDQITLEKLQKDLKSTATSLTQETARQLVDRFYQVQRDRIRAEHQARMAEAAKEPNELLDFFAAQAHLLEKQIGGALDSYSGAHPVGVWARSNKGVGPIISAGLLAHIDIAQCPTVGHIWSFAGLNPTKVWEKGQKRPWNTDLKTLVAYKLGEAFVKVCNYEDAFYGQLYKEHKEIYQAKNERGGFAENAKLALANKRYGKETVARKFYEQGQLPPAHIHAMARRWAVKIFLSHLHMIWYWEYFREAPPKPFAISVLGHAHEISPPNWSPPAA